MYSTHTTLIVYTDEYTAYYFLYTHTYSTADYDDILYCKQYTVYCIYIVLIKKCNDKIYHFIINKKIF